MSNVEDLLSQLWTAASQDGNEEILDAIAQFVNLEKILRGVNKNTEIDEKWEKIIIRKEYTSNELRALFSRDFLENSGSTRILEKIMTLATDKNKTTIAENMLTAGLTASLLKTIGHWNPEPVKSSLNYPKFSVKSFSAFTHRVPFPGEWDRSTMQVFEILDIDVPDDYDPGTDSWANRSDSGWWTESRMAACDAWVGQIVDQIGLPSIKMSEGTPCIIHSALAIAFMDEHERIQAKGVWHKENFPNYLPVVAKSVDADALIDIGAVRIDPVFNVKVNDVSYPHHGFKDKADKITDHEVAKALTLLSTKTVERFRFPTDDQELVLIPSNALSSLQMDLTSPPKELVTAIRYHRPDYLYSMLKGDDLLFRLSSCRQMHLAMYCRGLPLWNFNEFRYPKELDIFSYILTDHAHRAFINSKEEIAYINELANKSSMSPNQPYSLIVENPHDPIEEQVSNYKKGLEEVSHRFKCNLPVKYIGSIAFLSECAKQKCYSSGSSSVFSVNGYMTAHEQNTIRRLRANLGCLPINFKVSVETDLADLISTGVRMRDEGDISTIWGLIDRYPIEEVGQTASTEAQVRFLIKAYPPDQLLPHVDKKVRVKIEKELKRSKIESDLGL